MGPLPLSGLWRAFSYLSETQEQIWNGGSAASIRTTRYYYNADCNWGSPIDAYGNLGCTVELDRGTEVRATKRWYINRNTEVWTRNETTKVDSVAVSYLVDRAWGEAIYNGTASGATLVGLTHWLYDATTAFQAIGTRGDLTLERRYVNLPTSGTCCAGLLLKGQDTQYTYDTYGNRLSVDTFDQPGTTQDTLPSSPGNGSLNRRTWTNYDSIFHVFPIITGNAQGHTQEATYDYRMGTLIGIDGPNPNAAGMPTGFTCATAFGTHSSTVIADDRTCAQYDRLGRLIKLIKPGDSGNFLTQTVVYTNATALQPFNVQLWEREQSGTYNRRYTTKFYDGLGRVIETKLESNKGSQYSSIVTYTDYNADGQPVKQSQPFELIESSSSGVFTFTISNTAALSGMRWTRTTYDGLGRVLTTTTPAPDSQTTTHIYWVLGSNKLQIHDVIDPLRHRIQYRTDSFGRLAAVAEIAGNCSKPSHNYWPQYQCPSESDPNYWQEIGTTSYASTTLDQLDTVTDMAGNVTNADYDSLGRKIKLIDPDMGTWYYDYDSNGNLHSQIGADLGTLHFTYDWIGRPTSRIGQDGSNTSFADTFNAKDTTNWSWNTYQTVPFSDSGVSVAKNTGTGSNYNASFQRNGYSLSHGEGLTLRFKVSSTSPKALWMLESDGSPYQRVQILADNGKLRIQYTYDGVYYSLTDDSMDLLANAWYRLSMTVDKLGVVGVHVFQESDPAKRMRGQVINLGVRNWRFRQAIYTTASAYTDAYTEHQGATYGYDTFSAGANFGVGRRTLQWVIDGATTNWTYDARGRVTSTTYGSPAIGVGREFTQTYDSADRVATIVYPATGYMSQETITYAYDAAWRQVSACSNLSVCYAQQAGYEPSGAPDHWKLGNNLFQNWMYDTLNRPIRLQLGTDASVDQENDNANAGPASVFDRKYAYDAVGNITGLTDQRNIEPAQTFTYDDQNRLASWQLGSTTQTYAYSTLGNLTTKGSVTQGYGPQSASCPHGALSKPHALVSAGTNSYCYDRTGNMVSGAGRSYLWTATNMPYQITTPGGVETYTYGADDARVTRTRAGVTTFYAGGLWEEGGDEVRKYYTLGGQTVAVRSVLGALTGTNVSTSVTYLQGDHLGSVSVAVPESGPAAAQEFDPWGRVRSGSVAQTRRSFTGQYLDETGLLFYNARYYDPAIGRFISADTIVPRPSHPQELNRYSYVNNNPLRYTDPSGHCIAGCVIEIGIAIALLVAIAVIAADSGGRHAAANPIPWCRYLNCLGDGSSPQRNAQASSDTGGQINPNGPAPTPPSGNDQKHYEDLGTEWRDNGTRGNFKPHEAESAARLEQIVGRLERFNPTKHPMSKYGDWIDTKGITYDGVGPAPSAHFRYDQFTRTLIKHLDKQGVDYVVVDLTGLDATQSSSVQQFINSLNQARQARIMILGP